MDVVDTRGSVSEFFRGICGIIECEANHLCVGRAVDTLEKINTETTCCFNKMIISIWSENYKEALNICKQWEQDGLDIVLCATFKNDNGEVNVLFERWDMCKLDESVRRVAYDGCLKMFELCKKNEQVNKKSGHYDFVMCYAAYHGFDDIVGWCRKLGAEDFYNAIYWAIRGGYIQIVKLCEKWRVDDFDNAMNRAAFDGHTEIVKLCKELGEDHFSIAMSGAAEGGHIEIIRLCKEWGANDFRDAMIGAAFEGHIEIVKLCKEWGTDNFDDSMCLAACKGHVEIVKLCKEWGATDFERAGSNAAKYGHIEITKLCKEWGSRF